MGIFDKSSWESTLGDVSDWLGLSAPEFDYSADVMQNRWGQQNQYGKPGGLGGYVQQATQTRAQGYGPSVAQERQQQALSGAMQAGAANLAARQGRMGGQAALQAALMGQQQATGQAIQQFGQQRAAEQARAQGDYMGYLNAATKEQVAQDRINAAYSQLNLEAKLAEQEARRKQKGGLFGGIGGMIASIFS